MSANWDMTPFFKEFQDSDYVAFRDRLVEGFKAAQTRVGELGPITEASLADWASLLLQWEDMWARSTHLSSYLECLRAADARDQAVAQEYAQWQQALSEARKLEVLVAQAFRACSEADFQALLARPELDGAEFRLSRLRQEARYQMETELEMLAAELEVDGLSAWGRLYDQVSGTLEFELEKPDGSRERVPMSLKTSLLENPDGAIRKAALVGSNREWQRVQDVLAACLNAIAGTRLTLYRRRGIGHFLEPALFGAAISRGTLDAMFSAIADSYEIPRRYLRLKARMLGRERLGFQDLSCPLPLKSDSTVSWQQACGRISREFGNRYPALGRFCDEAFEKRWIDYEPRTGKRPGGFCTSSEFIHESRIFMTFNSTVGDVQTLAHELGHAHHAHVMRDLRPYQLSYPMTLAETASTFAETVLTDALLDSPDSSPEQKAVVLDTRLEQAAAFLLNIPMRFHFENRFYTERAAGEVSVARLQELMLDAQRECYGDALAEDELDPYFWASKLHFYITEVSFYNFPYSFGYLFSLGVYARAKQEGPAFFSKYEELLRLTGSDTAENVARRSLGVDLEQPRFWLDSIALIEQDLKRFEAEVVQLVTNS